MTYRELDGNPDWYYSGGEYYVQDSAIEGSPYIEFGGSRNIARSKIVPTVDGETFTPKQMKRLREVFKEWIKKQN